jgi:oxygen-dependent protoporphyrinogen oxidase
LTAAARVAVVGGGLSGLSAAHRLLELADGALSITLIESQSRLGGSVWTKQVGGYQVDGGADMFMTIDKPWALELCERLGIAGRLIAPNRDFRHSLVLRGGKPARVPDGFELMAPTRLGAMFSSDILSPWAKLRMAAELVLPRGPHGGDESVASFVRRRFGNEALERLVQPLVGGIYTGDLEKLSIRATLPRFVDMERDDRSVIVGALRRQRGPNDKSVSSSGARYGMFVGFPGGMQELTDALVARLQESVELRLDEPVTAVRGGDGGGYRVELANEELQFDAVVVATPAWSAAELVRSWSTPLARRLASIEHASAAVVVSGHRLADIEHPLDAYGLVVPAAEQREVLAVSFASRKFAGRAPEGRVQLRTFIGGDMQAGLFSLSDEELLRLARAELEQMFGLTGREDFAFVARHARGLPQYHVGHLDLLNAIDREVERYPGLALAGNAYRGVGIPDCVHSGEQAAERVLDALQLADLA